jgi:hypothetical protein
MIQGLTAMRQNNMSMIEQMYKTLEEEEGSDNQMRTQYAQKWNRLPSSALNLQFKNSLNDFKNKASMASEQDLKVEDKWN